MGEPDEPAAVKRGSSWREWARPAAARSGARRDPGDHDDEFGLQLDWPSGANTLTPADRPSAAVTTTAVSTAVDPMADVEEWEAAGGDEPAAGAPATRAPRRVARRPEPAADAANRVLGPLLPAMYERLDDVTDRLAATEAAMLRRLADIEDLVLRAVETADAPVAVDGLVDLAADVADVRRQLGALREEAQEIRGLAASALTESGRRPDVAELRDAMAETVRAAVGVGPPAPDLTELRDAVAEAVRGVRDELEAMADDAQRALREQLDTFAEETKDALRKQLQTMADAVASQGDELRTVGEELTQLRRRVGVRARPPQLDEASMDKLAEVVIDRLASSFEVVTDTSPEPTSTRRRRGTR